MHILIIDDNKKSARKAQELLKKQFGDVQVDKVSDYNEATELCKSCADDKKPVLYARCYGYFEAYINGVPLHFKRSRAKELLAYLVDRRGATVTNRELCSILWPDEVENPSISSQCRTLIASLKKTLDEAGVGDVLEKSSQGIRIVPEKIMCDFYEFMADPMEANVFNWEYMSQYEWSEVTAAELWRVIEIAPDT